MPWVGFEPTISAGERPKTYALDRTATGTGSTAPISDIIRTREREKVLLDKLKSVMGRQASVRF